MNNILSPLNNENGAALFIAVLIMLVATVIGFAATQNASIELKIAGNQRVYQRAFYRSDAATMEGAQRLYHVSKTNPELFKDPGLYPKADDPVTGQTNVQWFFGTADTSNLEDINNWVSNGGGYGFYSDVNPNDNNYPAFAVAYQGVAPGAQWEMGQPSMRLLAIFSLYDPPTPEQVFLTTGFLVEY